VGSRDRGWRRWREFLANNSWFLRWCCVIPET
jgi:hypothetical protein